MGLPLTSKSVSDGRKARGSKEESERELWLRCRVWRWGSRARPEPRDVTAQEDSFRT